MTRRMLLFGGLGIATQARSKISGVVSGYVVHPGSETLRAMEGLPGAATLGPALEIPAAVSAASVLWSREAGLDALVAGTNGELYQYQYKEAGGTARCVAVPNSIGKIDQILRNRWSNRPALAYSSTNRLLQWHGTAGAGPVIPVADELAAIALAPEGERAIAAGRSPADGTNGLFEIRRDTIARLAFGGCPVCPVFFRNGRDLLAGDETRDQILHIKDAFETPEVRILAGPAAGIESPLALALDDAGRQLLAVTRQAGLFVIDVERAVVTANLPLPFQPVQCRRLLLPNTFLLSDVSASPLYVAVLDDSPKLFFVPVQP